MKHLSIFASTVALSLALGCSRAAPVTVQVPARDAPPQARTLVVTSSARIGVVPDEACVELVVSHTAPSVLDADTPLRADVRAFLDAARALAGVRTEVGLTELRPEVRRDAFANETRTGFTARTQVNARTRDFNQVTDILRLAAARDL